MYQNTSRLLPNLVDNIVVRDNRKRFEPLLGKMKDSVPTSKRTPPLAVDRIKLSYINKIINLCKRKDVGLVFMTHPLYNYDEDSCHYWPAINLCKQKFVAPYHANNE